uniref:Gypsy retrotransposon integrase-like protein 1 n=1 Tax=Vombatus ursinus TaxID=29139 RepID=A0A4X2JUY6_VOMUR
MDGAVGPPQGPEEEETAAAAATAPGPGPGGNKFADIRRLLAEGAFPPAFGSIKRKNLKRYAQKFVLEGGCLYYVGPKKEEKREVVVDPERRHQVFLESHFTEVGHHLGQKKTVHRIQSRYYWLGIVKDVVDWIRMCQTCQNAEHAKNVVRKARPVKAEAPWEILGMEIQGPFPETARANTHVLIVTDYFTKWIEAVPLRKKDALSVAKALASLFYRFGASKNIYSSQSWAFCEEVSRHLGEHWSISQTLTPSAAPDPMGLDEATAELLKAALQSMVKEKQPDWDEHLDPVVFGFRTTVSSVTKHTPFFLMFNRRIHLSSEVIDNTAASGKGDRRGVKRKAGRLPALAFSVEDRGFTDSPLKKLKQSSFVSFQLETILPSEQPPAAEGKQSPSAEH